MTRSRRIPEPQWLAEAICGEINRAAVPLRFLPEDYDPLLSRIGDRTVVMIGEASHGTHDFYRERARITRRLIEEKGFNAVAIEGDWPDASRVHRFVTGKADFDSGESRDAQSALGDFLRFPAWMWRNMDVLSFVEWLRQWNARRAQERPAGFYGLDLYGLHASIRAVLDYLDKVDPKAARRARYRYACFEDFGEDPQAYGYAASFDLSQSCEDQAVAQLVEMRRRSGKAAGTGVHPTPEDSLFAEHNARLVQNAERYYRTMFEGGAGSWNLRDHHMFETLEWLRSIRPGTRVVVWAHNSHLGDARATAMHDLGEINLGQLARERWGGDVFLLGFTTHSGEVTAASAWDAPAERKRVRPALPESCEDLLHHTGIPAFFLSLHEDPVRSILNRPLLERAIGVVYRPNSERVSHYFRSRLSAQFDAVIHLDRTLALIPFEQNAQWIAGELPETWPFAV